MIAARGLRFPVSVRACLFDLDGVLTETAALHAAAWKQLFDGFLRRRAAAAEREPALFDEVRDYHAYVDGRPRADGVRAFLAARGLELPEGSAGDPPSQVSVHGLANAKNELVHRLIAERGVQAYPGSVRFVAAVRAAGLACAVVSSSENTAAVLEAALPGERFDALVDGRDLHELGLAGKPAPDAFLEAARRLGVAPAQAAVFEDALVGVAAGRAGGFGFVVGVDRAGEAAELHAAGADTVVADLAELLAG